MKAVTRRSFIQNIGMGIGTLAATPPLASFMNAEKQFRIFEERKLNIALCGLGNYARMLADGLNDSKYCRLAGIITGHSAKAAQWQKDYNIPKDNIYNYQNFDDVRNNKNIDLVYVVVPNGLHKEFVVRAAKAGKHVITEKPMAITVTECGEMIQACKDAGVQLAVGYRLHYEPYHLEIKRLGQQKVFGQVRLINASLGYRTYDTTQINEPDFDINNPAEWRLKKSLSGGGPLMDLGIYCVQCCRYVLGEEPVSVTAQYGAVNNKKRFSEVEETITWQMEFPGGAISDCVSSYGFNIDRFFASADNGTIEMSPALSYGPFKGRTSSGELRFPVINQQATQLDEIGKVILAGKPLPSHITGEEGLKDIRIMMAIYNAASTGKKILI
ncbi:MAG: Gfo/Idh/MocA family oxidoreductase [Ginsengibacter sp.]